MALGWMENADGCQMVDVLGQMTRYNDMWRWKGRWYGRDNAAGGKW